MEGVQTLYCMTHLRDPTKLRNGVLSNGQQLQSIVNAFIDQGRFEAAKTLSDRRVPRCDEHQFHAKMTVST